MASQPRGPRRIRHRLPLERSKHFACAIPILVVNHRNNRGRERETAGSSFENAHVDLLCLESEAKRFDKRSIGGFDESFHE